MDQWKRTLLDKLSQAQGQWCRRFEESLDRSFVPAYEEHKNFLADNGFKLSTPMREPGRRSFKFELSENAYLLIILRATGVGEFELHTESFVPGGEPTLNKSTGRVADMDEAWAEKQIKSGIDGFVDLLLGQNVEPVGELITV